MPKLENKTDHHRADMIIDCVSDLHGHYPQLEGGDLLIVAGDLTARDEEKEYWSFSRWVRDQNYKEKFVIAGNHDNWLKNADYKTLETWSEDHGEFEYLCDSGAEFSYEEDDIEMEECGMHPTVERTVKIWGSPWTKTFPEMNPKCKAFTVDTEEELAEKWALIPRDVDILVTHSPAYGFGDLTQKEKHVGSPALTRWIADHVRSLKLHICGHVHEAHAIYDPRKLQNQLGEPTTPVLVNASYVNERYQPVNKPIRVILM